MMDDLSKRLNDAFDFALSSRRVVDGPACRAAYAIDDDGVAHSFPYVLFGAGGEIPEGSRQDCFDTEEKAAAMLFLWVVEYISKNSGSVAWRRHPRVELRNINEGRGRRVMRFFADCRVAVVPEWAADRLFDPRDRANQSSLIPETVEA